MKTPSRADYRRNAWPKPLKMQTRLHKPRRLGVELEFIGLQPKTAAEILQKHFGGRIVPVSDYEIRVEDTRHGHFNVELDFGYLKARGRARGDAKPDTLEGFAEDLAEGVIALVAKQLVPLEIVTPPIPMADLWELEDLMRAVRQAGAKGTNQSPTYAFGLHLNPELPSVDGETLRRYLQAFVCLYPWLMRRGDIDLSRRITPYIDTYPKAYLQLLLQPDYLPSCEQLIDDYLKHNPTRNRGLDMLPIFASIDEDRVRAAVGDAKVNVRPTLHYRLPNCQIDEHEWQLVHPWRDFLQLDALAAQPALLMEACAECLKRVGKLGEPLFGNWSEAAYRWVLPELL